MLIFPVVELAGTVIVSDTLVAAVTIASRPLNFTTLSVNVELKLLPVMVTDVPGNPLEGAILVIIGDSNTVKSAVEIAVCPLMVTDIFPVDAPVGTITLSNSELTNVTVAEIPLNITALFAIVGLKFVPVIMTTVPAIPLVGEKPVIDGCVISFLHEFAESRQIKSINTLTRTHNS